MRVSGFVLQHSSSSNLDSVCNCFSTRKYARPSAVDHAQGPKEDLLLVYVVTNLYLSTGVSNLRWSERHTQTERERLKINDSMSQCISTGGGIQALLSNRTYTVSVSAAIAYICRTFDAHHFSLPVGCCSYWHPQCAWESTLKRGPHILRYCSR